MARATTHHHLLLLLLLLQATTAMKSNKGFTVELIHRYSARSPYYNGNQTESQLLQKLLEQSRTHAQWLESTLSANISALRPQVLFRNYLYLVPLSIGTGDGKKSYFLQLDTGSRLTWIQCHPCAPCFPQPSPLFDPDASPTYRTLPNNHRLCTVPYRSDEDGNCAYNVRYEDGTSSRGVLSEDTFTFGSSHQRGRTELIPRLVFGCARATTMDPRLVGEWDGILGMGSSPVSIPGQTNDHLSFSYCLAKPGSRSNGYLQIGGYMGPRLRTTQTTAIRTYDGVPTYYLNLIDVSVSGRRLHLPQGTFQAHNSHNGGGCVIDTGAYYSFLIKQAYDVVKDILVGQFFTGLHLVPVHGRSFGVPFDVCYATPAHPEAVLPHMTLHFQGADYALTWEKLFEFHNHGSFFCWVMGSSDVLTILGAFQQHSVRWSYDLRLGTLSFVPQNCA